MITNFIQLDFNKENDLKVPSVQYDSGSRFVKIKLQQNKVPFEINGYRVTVVANKVDGTEIMNDCTILDGANGLVEFEITEQFNAVEGVVDCQLKLFKDEILLTSMPFSISVVKSVSTKEIVSSNELKTLVNALGEVQNIDNRFAQTNAQLSEKANDNEVIKKGYGTLNDFDEETRRVIQGMDQGQINAVLGVGNVKTENLADNSVKGDKIANLSVYPSKLVVSDETLQEDLFKKEIIQGEYVTSGGRIVVNPSYTSGRSGYMSVKEGAIYELFAYTTDTTVLGAFYDENKRFISHATLIAINDANIYRVIAPKNAKYFILNYADNKLSSTYFCKVGKDDYTFNWLKIIKSNLDDSVIDMIRDMTGDINNIPLSSINGDVSVDWIQQDLNIKTGHYVQPVNGLEAQYSNGDNGVSDFIAVNEGERIKYLGYTKLDNYNGCLYDINKNKIGNLVSPTQDGGVAEMTIPAGVCYVRLNLSELYMNESFLSVYREKKISLQALQLVESNIPNKLISKEMLSDEIELEIKDSSIGINKLTEDAVRELKSTEIINGSVTLSSLAQDVIAFIQQPSQEPINPFSNLKTTWIGDSITAGVGTTSSDNRYSNRVVKALSMSPSGYQNLGVSGSVISNTRDTSWTIKSFVTRICDEHQIKNGQDLIFILGGVNDLALNIPISTMNEQLEYYKKNGRWNDYTFYGALNRLITYIRENHSESELIYITPIHYEDENTRHTGNQLKYYVDAIREVCEYYAVPVIDLYKDLPLDPKNQHHKEKYTMNGSNTAPDGCHPSDLGNELIAKKIVNYLKYQYIM